MKLPFYKYFYAVMDFLIVLFSQFIAATIVTLDTPNKNLGNIFYIFDLSFHPYLIFTTISIFFVFIFQNNNLYKLNICLSWLNQIVRLIKSVFYGLIFLIVFSYFTKSSFILESRQFTIIFTFSCGFLLFFSRVIILRKIIQKLFKEKILKKHIIIIGGGKSGKFLATKLLIENDHGIIINGFLDDKLNIGTEILPSLYVLGNTDELEDVTSKIKVDEVIIAIDNITYEKLLEIIDKCLKLKIRVSVASSLFDIIPEKLETEKYSNIPIIEISPRLNDEINIKLKRIFDFIGALLGIILLLPLFLVIAILIKFSSKGPVLYTHFRVGKDGKLFKFYKFRSMTITNENDEERKKMMIEFMKNGKTQNGKDTKILNSSRVTKIGSFIRKTSIDELPQLINVLKGEMSLVGPRPALPYEYENYDNWQKRRVKVLPGCTGLWQISGRSSVSFKDSIILDLYYINNMSPWLDLQIILKTIPVMIFAKGGK